jgi:hypothetical protein
MTGGRRFIFMEIGKYIGQTTVSHTEGHPENSKKGPIYPEKDPFEIKLLQFVISVLAFGPEFGLGLHQPNDRGAFT